MHFIFPGIRACLLPDNKAQRLTLPSQHSQCPHSSSCDDTTWLMLISPSGPRWHAEGNKGDSKNILQTSVCTTCAFLEGGSEHETWKHPRGTEHSAWVFLIIFSWVVLREWLQQPQKTPKSHRKGQELWATCQSAGHTWGYH
jgi:hypothetical protein